MTNNTPKTPLQVIKSLFRRNPSVEQSQNTRMRSQRVLSARERYQAGIDQFDPIKAIIEKLRNPASNDGNSFGAPSEDKEVGNYPFQKFWDKFCNQITEQYDGKLALTQTRQLKMLNLAMFLSEIHASEKEQLINRFYAEFGISNYNLLQNSHLITDRIGKNVQGKMVGSVLERIVIDVLKHLPNSRTVIKYVGEHDVTLEEIIKFTFDKNNCMTDKRARDDLNHRIIKMMAFFEEDIDKIPELKALLKEIEAKIIDYKKTIYQTESEDNPEVKKAFEDNIKAIKTEFETRAPHAKSALEQLYRFKKLDGRQAFRLIQQAVDAKEYTFFEAIGIDIDAIVKEYFFTEIQPKIQKSEENDQWPTDLDQKSLLPKENDSMGWCKFLINTCLGKKVAQIINLDNSFFADTLTQSVNKQINKICPLLQSTEASSFDDLIEKLAKATDIDVSHYIALVMVSRNRYSALEQNNKQLWAKLNDITTTPPVQRGKLMDVVMRIARALKSTPNYSNVEGSFNRLAYAVLGHYNVTSSRKRQQNTQKTDKEYIDMCIDAMDRGDEGFNKDYLYNMPISDKDSINFNDFDRDGTRAFTFEHLMEIYAKHIPDSALIDIAYEIENDIFLPIIIESGINLSDESQYDGSNDNYINENDFELAKKIGEALRGLKKAKLNRLPKDEKEEENPIANTAEEKYVLTDQDKKASRANVQNILSEIKEIKRKKEISKQKTTDDDDTIR